MEKKEARKIKQAVKRRYSDLASQGKSCCESTCCAPASRTEKVKRIYSPESIQGLPLSVTETAAGCGNPTALGDIKPGQVVLDLGSGGGIDCFLAAQRVGREGRVIGLDMTPEMVSLARRNAEKLGLTNVEFRLGEMEHMPLESESVDLIISNCVINLSPDKDAVFREAFRVLKPGGRLCVSDIVWRTEVSPDIEKNLELWTECVAGALEKRIYLEKIRNAGFTDVEVASEADTSASGEWARNLASITVRAYKIL